MTQYELIDSGLGEKLERFGSYVLIRPCAQAIWQPALSNEEWDKADARFERLPNAKWFQYTEVPLSWKMELKGLNFHIERTNFGHVGLFPEHSELWSWIKDQIARSDNPSILNLFGYSGATTLFAAKCGAKVCHLDASKKMVDRARENAALNEMDDFPIRWIVDDVFKFLKREEKRKTFYDGIVLDPPSFGRGAKGEVFKIETDFINLLESVKAILSKDAKFGLVTGHTEGITPITLKNLMQQVFKEGDIEVGELLIKSKNHDLPKGIYAKCHFK